LEWCKQQEWFKKYPIVYNICINQTITTDNSNSKTPEHNKLQNLFLEKENVTKMVNYIYKKYDISYDYIRCEFEGSFNWDIIIDECRYFDNDNDEYSLSNIYIELKPLLGDDYPCVLRKIKLQKELTLRSLQKEKQDMLDDVGYVKGKNSIYDYGSIKFREVNETWDFVNKNRMLFSGTFVLLINEYNSTNTPKDKLIEIFKQSDIFIVFTNDLFNGSSQTITEKVDQTKDITIHSIQEIKEEILSLKTQKQGKSIKDYFGKK
jgi:hypothetical protein